MSLEITRGAARDATRELTQAFQLSNFCRELAKAKPVPGSERTLGQRQSANGCVEEKPGEYGNTNHRPKNHE